MLEKSKVVVSQMGSRHRYRIPLILNEASLLERLYTDTSSYSLIGKALNIFGKKTRTIPQQLRKELVISTDVTTIANLFYSCKYEGVLLHLKLNDIFGNYIKKNGLGKAKIFYNFNIGSINLLSYLKLCKVKIISDIFIHPLTSLMMHQEEKLFGFSSGKMLEEHKIYFYLYQKIFELSDILLCPSEWVADGVRSLSIDDSHKIRICPYGSSIDYSGKSNNPIKGKIFWAGGDWLRKGLHHLAMAADQLKRKYPNMEFCAAGIVDSKIINMPRFKNIKFLGKLNTEQMKHQFLTSDIFVFPTISEGMAGVVIEAMAAGCPVITTKAAGIDAIENNISGLIIPSQNIDALIESIEQLYLNRDTRNIFSKRTKELAFQYSIAAWSKRLIKLIEETAIL